MAIPGIPQNLSVQTGNGQVCLDWQASVGATSYSISRSTDNITFSVVATQSSYIYVDTGVAVGTRYFYKVAAVNSSGMSGYTGAKDVIPVLASDESLASLRLQAQQKADLEGSDFISKSEWNKYINQSAKELYDLLVTQFEDMYVADPYQVTLSNSDTISLPSDFYKALGVDVAVQGSNFQSLRRFNFADRNQYSLPNQAAALARGVDLKYRILGQSIKLTPYPSTGQTLRLWYVPKMKDLLLDTDVLVGVSGWSEYVIIDAAIKAMLKEESDPSAQMAQKQALIRRINDAASNRDAGMPQTITNTRDMNSYDPFGYGEG